MPRFLSLINNANAVAGSDIIVSARVTGDANDRFQIADDGTLTWGPASTATDTTLRRTGVGLLALTGSAAKLGVMAGTASSTGVPSSQIHTVADTINSMRMDAYGGGIAGNDPQILTTRANGTFAAPADIASGDALFDLIARGVFGGSNRSAVRIVGTVDGVPSGSFVPGRLEFQTAGAASSISNRLLLNESGATVTGFVKATAAATAITADIYGGEFIATWTPSANDSSHVLRGLNIEARKAGAFDATATWAVRGLSVAANLQSGAGNLTFGVGLMAQINNFGAGTYNLAYGVLVIPPTATGPIGSVFGVRVDKQGGANIANPYAFYQTDPTDRSFFGGRIGIGSNNAGTDHQLRVGGVHPGTAANLYSLYTDLTVPATTTGTAANIQVLTPTTTAAAFTLVNAIGVYTGTGTAAGSGSTITNRYGILAAAQTGATNNYTARFDSSSTACLWVGADVAGVAPNNGIVFGSGSDVNLYRSGANTLNTDDLFMAQLGVSVQGGTLFLADAVNLQAGTSTGSKFGTTATQKLGWWGTTPVIRETGWTITNNASTRTLDCTAATLTQVAQVLGSLLNVLKSYGLIGA